MRGIKSAAPMLAGAIILVFAGVISYIALTIESKVIANISISEQTQIADSQLAEALRTGNGLPVKLGLVGDGPPIVYVTRLNPSESLASYSSCAPKPTPPTAPQIKCWQGYTLFSTLTQRWMDAGTSIQEIDKMLESIKNLMDTDLNKRTSIDGLSVYVVPGGRDTNPGFSIAENIEMKCLGDKTQPGTPGAVVPIGIQASTPTTLFDNAPSDLIAELQGMKRANADTNSKIQPKLASPNISLTSGENISLAKTALSLHSALSGRHIGISQEMMNRHYSTLVQTKVPLHFQANLVRDKNGNTVNCNSSVSGPLKLLASGYGLGGDYFRTNLVIDELGYTGVCIPDASLLSIIKKDMQAHITRLQKLRTSHATRQATLSAQLKDLVSRGYNCQ